MGKASDAQLDRDRDRRELQLLRQIQKHEDVEAMIYDAFVESDHSAGYALLLRLLKGEA